MEAGFRNSSCFRACITLLKLLSLINRAGFHSLANDKIQILYVWIVTDEVRCTKRNSGTSCEYVKDIRS